ncbi:MAG: hypothetical protein QM820_19180 [Minicystis sp.]
MRKPILAVLLLALGCSGSVETEPSTSSTGTGGAGTGGAGTGGTGGSGAQGGGGAGGGPSASCAEAKVLWSRNSDVPWVALAVAPDGSVYTLALGGQIQKLAGTDGSLIAQLQAPNIGAFHIAAGPGGRLLVGPDGASPAYRVFLDNNGMLVPGWTLDAESLGLPDGIWGTRGAVTAEGQFAFTGSVDGKLPLIVLDDSKKKVWEVAQSPADSSGWMLSAANGTGVVTFKRGPGTVTRWAAGGAVVWSTPYDPGTAGVGDIAAAPSGDVYVLGLTDFPSDFPFSLGRISAEGKPMWMTTFPSNADESITCGVAPLPDGGAMLCTGFEHGLWGIQRLSSDGKPLWSPEGWFAADCGSFGTVMQIAGSPDGAVVMLTSTGVVKIAP